MNRGGGTNIPSIASGTSREQKAPNLAEMDLLQKHLFRLSLSHSGHGLPSSGGVLGTILKTGHCAANFLSSQWGV